jgi:hypothetical protein
VIFTDNVIEFLKYPECIKAGNCYRIISIKGDKPIYFFLISILGDKPIYFFLISIKRDKPIYFFLISIKGDKPFSLLG